ncbi:class I SAM-dependent methyltransferase [Streptomyces sp. NPDC059874]|uniref:class I SAM-dependent methyltransferase n=1 Tax=Streptomyces sp. NPDC059874 TaxID=3346983 RepID=UPI0036532C6B
MTTWDSYAGLTPVGRAGPPPLFSWTPFPGHGPGSETLGIDAGSTVLELGCGKGDRLAYLASLGVRAVGVDISAVQVAAATARWGSAVEVHRADAVHYLQHRPDSFDAVYSAFGAHWFTDPELLLPAIRSRLREDGVVTLAHVPPGDDFDSDTYAPVPDVGPVLRWEGEATQWANALQRCGFVQPRVVAIPPPVGSRGVRTVVIRALG